MIVIASAHAETSVSNRSLLGASAMPELDALLTRGDLPPALFEVSAIRCETVRVATRDGTRLATDLYLPPVLPAPVVVMRTPYDRANDNAVAAFLSFARRGYVVVSQDCRGTGDSEPESWDYYVYEAEDGVDCIDWVTRQPWFGGFIGSVGSSYVGQTQWCMALHPAMSTIVPTVSGLGVAVNTAHLYMFLNAYARTVGKGEDKTTMPLYEMERVFESETIAGGYFNEPLHRSLWPAELLAQHPDLRVMSPSQAQRFLWERYCAMTGEERATFIKQALDVKNVTTVAVEFMTAIFGHRIAHDSFTIPQANPAELCRMIHAPPLLWTGWYDWGLNDTFATWELLRREARPEIARRARLVVTPCAHNMPGYHEGFDRHPELARIGSIANQAAMLLRWYEVIREGRTDAWPTVIYYLMGANEWRFAADWPLPEARAVAIYLDRDGSLAASPPSQASPPDHYTYNPFDPTPTIGGSIVSFMYPPGSVDVSAVQQRPDVLVYTSVPLERDLDIVGPVQVILYASSSAVDTDFVARLSDVFPDGRAIQIQSGILRARYRNRDGEPSLLEPGRVYRFEIDLWHTANRFKAGHRLRVDISSADFPHFDRHSNRAGEPGLPIPAQQTIYHDAEHPSHLLVAALGEPMRPAGDLT